MINVLLVGSGAREHAIARAISCSRHTINLYCIGEHINPGITLLAETKQISLKNIDKVINEIQGKSLDIAIIGPEEPLGLGLADALIELGIKVVGPTKALAQIETSKDFSRNLMKKYAPDVIPKYQTFTDIDSLNKSLIQRKNYVIKASGLMGGKGVYISGEHFNTTAEALKIADKLFDNNESVLIEEKLIGEEFSLLSFCDGETLVHMPLVQDNKRAYYNDQGPNTGGMGSVSYASYSLPFLPDDCVQEAQSINERAIEGLQEEVGERYCGILYGGYMFTASGVKLIEYNARFGDPEAINLLGLLSTDFIEICLAMAEGRLKDLDVFFDPKATVCKYVVPQGYPESPNRGEKIDVDPAQENLYIASVIEDADGFKLLGSRAVAVLGVGDNLLEAELSAESLAGTVKGPVYYRADIGTSALMNKRQNRIEDRLKANV
jgi:phosphoribosylamine--glycine ligase